MDSFAQLLLHLQDALDRGPRGCLVALHKRKSHGCKKQVNHRQCNRFNLQSIDSSNNTMIKHSTGFKCIINTCLWC